MSTSGSGGLWDFPGRVGAGGDEETREGRRMKRERRPLGGASAATLAALVALPVFGGAPAASAGSRPSRPAGLRAANITGGIVLLRWRPSARASTYRVIRNGRARGTGIASARFADRAVSPFTAYSYSVVACNGSGCSRRSPDLTVVTRGGACRGVGLTPRRNIQRAIDAHGERTTFCLSGGTYHVRRAIIPKSYDVIWGAPGAVLTGDGSTPSALLGHSHYQRHVRVRGLTIQHFAGPEAAVAAGNNWVVEGNRIGYNAKIGVRAQDGSTIRGNYVHHNGVFGMAATLHLNGATFSHNVVAFNDTKRDALGGGAKILLSSYDRFLGNYVHDNLGNGLHCDTDCIHIVFAGNRVTGNRGIGIIYEASFAAVMRGNVVAGNDREAAGRSLHFGSQIRLLSSSSVEIYGNRVVASVRGTNGIGLVDVARGSGRFGTYRIAGDYVHDNVVVLGRGGMSGLVGTAHRPRTLNNRFRDNHYHVARVSGGHFAWVTYPMRWRGWRAAGQDRTGSIRAL